MSHKLNPFAIRVALVVAIVAATLTRQATASDPAPPNPIDPALVTALQGKWKNELKSLMTINTIDAASGAISGVYQILDKQTGQLSKEFPLVGWVNTAPAVSGSDNAVVVTFAVRFGTFGSSTVWSGYYKNPQGGQPVIVGQWLLSRPNASDDWAHILAGQDQFNPNP